MRINEKEISIVPISYTIVIVWKTPLNQFPFFDNETLKNFFDAPSTTEHSITRAGINVKQAVPPVLIGNNIMILQPEPFLQFGFDKMSLRNISYSSFISSYRKVEELLKANANLIDYTPQQMGVNIDYEINFIHESAHQVFNSMFSAPKPNDAFVDVNFDEVKLNLKEDTSGKAMNLVIQPRAMNPQSLFIQVNDHIEHANFKTFAPTEELSNIFTESKSKFESTILPFLL